MIENSSWNRLERVKINSDTFKNLINNRAALIPEMKEINISTLNYIQVSNFHFAKDFEINWIIWGIWTRAFQMKHPATNNFIFIFDVRSLIRHFHLLNSYNYSVPILMYYCEQYEKIFIYEYTITGKPKTFSQMLYLLLNIDISSYKLVNVAVINFIISYINWETFAIFCFVFERMQSD